MERKEKLGIEGSEYEESVHMTEASSRNRNRVISSRDEARLNQSLNKLQIMIDRGEVELESDDSGATEEEAIEDALRELEEEKKNQEKEDKDSGYLLSSDDGEESEEDFFGSNEYFSSSVEKTFKSERESTVRSNDIAIDMGDSSSSDEDQDEESEDEEEEKVILRDVDKPKGSFNRHSLSRKSRRSTNRVSKTSKSNTLLNPNVTYTAGTRVRKREPRESTSRKSKHKDEGDYDGFSEEARKKDLIGKKDVERILSGYGLKKDKIKKLAQQKINQKAFRDDAKERLQDEENKKELERKKNNREFDNQEKKRKMKSKLKMKVSSIF